MESQAVRRRINTISGHFAPRLVTEDVIATQTHLLPLNCSNNLSTPFRRFDCRVQFGRQASSAQGYFMRQSIPSAEQDNSIQRPRVCSAKYSNVEKSTDAKPPLFSRPAAVEPLYSKPAEMDLNCSNSGVMNSLPHDKMSTPECPKFARPGGAICEENQLSTTRKMFSTQINGMEWSPRINVAESKTNHVISVELPGVDIKYIRVEMDDKNIMVKCKRSVEWWKVVRGSNDSFATYHKREIQQGPCQLVWPLPPDSQKDAVSAEFVEGILQITIPKL